MLKIPCGKKYFDLELKEENFLQVILPKEQLAPTDPNKAMQEAMENPIGSPRLVEIATKKNPKKVVIIVNDTTRPTPYDIMLPPMMTELEEAGVRDEQITFVIATGSHRGNTDKENRAIFGDHFIDRYRFVNHDCDAEMVSLGQLADGSELWLNPHVAEADLLITTGLITLHYFAGYSGGRKSVLPGVVGRDLITFNHSKMTEPGARTGNYKDNPVHWIMVEAARLAGVDFIVNVVTNENKQIVKIVAGELEQAWETGVEYCDAMNIVEVPTQADVVIASAGGYPKDINIYQAQKALDNAEPACIEGGTIILVAECPEGFGEHTFEEWMKASNSIEDIFTRFDQGFVLGGHKAYAICKVLKEKEIVLVSGLSVEDVKNLHMTPCKTLEEALKYVEQKHGKAFKAYVMPQAGMVLPRIVKED